MAIYVMSDIHGEYEMFMSLLEELELSSEDTLYVLGDVLDRGPSPIEVLLEMMKHPNIIPIAGNHELMALDCLDFLMKEVTEEHIEELDEQVVDDLLLWQQNGGMTTMEGFYRLNKVEKEEVRDYIESFSGYEEVTVNGERYVLVHAGLGNFSPKRALEDYSIEELVWSRTDYEEMYFPDRYVVTGHTPTQAIFDNPNPGYVYRKSRNIAIDCGACFEGRLAAVCLDTGEEFYQERE